MSQSRFGEFHTEERQPPETEDGRSVEMPPEPPEKLLEVNLPPIFKREEIAPNNPDCDVKNGDLMVHYVGTEAMDWYGFLILNTHGLSKLVGLTLPSCHYSTQDLDRWVNWYVNHTEDGEFTQKTQRLYENVAPLNR